MALNTVRLHHGLLSGEFTSLWEKTLNELAALAAGAAPEPLEALLAQPQGEHGKPEPPA